MNDYSTHPEYLAMMETIRTFPNDAAPRWIIADWIQDQEDNERAEFIRKQMTLHDWRIEWRSTSAGDWVSSGEGDPASNTLMRDLIVSGKMDDWGPGGLIAFRRGFLEEVRLPCEWFLRLAKTLFADYPITFVELTDIRPSEFLSGVAYLTEGVVLSNPPETILPRVIFDHLLKADCTGQVYTAAVFESTDLAVAALSKACVALGRERAKLLPL